MVRCESCKKEHDGIFGSGRFCSKSCANSFSTKGKREIINDKVAAKSGGVPESQIIVLIKLLLAENEFASLRYLSTKINASYCRLKRIIESNDIVLKKSEKGSRTLVRDRPKRTNIKSKRFNCYTCGNEFLGHERKKIAKQKFCSHECRKNQNQVVFREIENNELWKRNLGEATFRKWMKRYLIFKNGHQCSVCENTEWMNKPIPLVCDHIDGNSGSSDKDNFRLVCGNCDMQLDTYKSKNRGKGRVYDKIYYHKRRKFKDTNPS